MEHERYVMYHILHVQKFKIADRECLLVVGRGSQVVGRGFQVVGRGFQVVGRGFQVVGRGFQVVGRGSWVIDWKGSALARRRFLGIPSISKQTLSSLQQQIIHVFCVNSRETYSILHKIDQNSEICITHS